MARIGGGEFALLKRRTHAAADIEKLACSIVEAVSQPISINGRCVYTGTSVGIALAPKHGLSARELLDNADMAMYRAKAAPDRRWCHFSERLRKRAIRAERLAEEIRHGIDDGQFTVLYQPNSV